MSDAESTDIDWPEDFEWAEYQIAKKMGDHWRLNHQMRRHRVKLQSMQRHQTKAKSMQRPKLFALGFNKTGTTTISNMASQWGLRPLHGGEPWFKFLVEHDVFSDSDDIIRFRELHQQFPNAKFVLNTRSEIDWVRSRFKHRPDGWARPLPLRKLENGSKRGETTMPV